MSQLPPDPERLRAILAYLDRQIAENDTVGIYLRLQRDAVTAALAHAERPQNSRPRRLPKGGANLPDFHPVARHAGFVVQQQRRGLGPGPVTIHVGDCTMLEGPVHRIEDHDARVALADPNVAPCQFCRPDTELGIDVA